MVGFIKLILEGRVVELSSWLLGHFVEDNQIILHWLCPVVLSLHSPKSPCRRLFSPSLFLGRVLVCWDGWELAWGPGKSLLLEILVLLFEQVVWPGGCQVGSGPAVGCGDVCSPAAVSSPGKGGGTAQPAVLSGGVCEAGRSGGRKWNIHEEYHGFCCPAGAEALLLPVSFLRLLPSRQGEKNSLRWLVGVASLLLLGWLLGWRQVFSPRHFQTSGLFPPFLPLSPSLCIPFR